MRYIYLLFGGGLLSLSGAVPAGAQAPSQNQNYTLTTVVQEAGHTAETDITTLTPAQRQQQLEYIDGLGRPVQQIQVKASPTQQDLILPVVYDALGRPLVNYLPYAGGNNGAYQGNAPGQQATFYQATGDRVANDAAPWTKTDYEASPLSRVLRQGAPGTTWQPSTAAAWSSADHSIKYVYRTNLPNEVRLWECSTAAGSATSPGYYAPGQLAVRESWDENGHLLIEYKEGNGHVVLKKQCPTAGVLCGVRDDYQGNLVLQAPAGMLLTGIQVATLGRTNLTGSSPNSCDNLTFDPNCSGDITQAVRRFVNLTAPIASVSIPVDFAQLGVGVIDPCVGAQKTLRVVATYAPISDADNTLTQYVYDDFGQLRLVIQPEGMKQLPVAGGAGKLAREFWYDEDAVKPLNLGQVKDIRLYNAPSSVTTMSSFEAPDIDRYDNYGQRVRGYVTAPVTGDYTFWISSDDNSELWLSTSEDPSQKRRIAREDVWTPSRTWNWHPVQQSEPIGLIAGQRYYIEALQKEGAGGDNLAVGWQIPGGGIDDERPIPGSRLSTDAINLSADFITTWCFRYEYDARGRLIEKQVPGAGPIQFVYNRNGQQILQRGHAPLDANAWTATKYDGQGRIVLTGIVHLSDSNGPLKQADAQQQADAWMQAQWERPVTTTGVGYTFTEAFPALASDDDLLTVTYYDNYESNDLANAVVYAQQPGISPANRSTLTRGLVTGSKVRIISGINPNGGQWRLTVNYYDDERRLIQSRRELYPQGWERTTLGLDFMGRTRLSLLEHNVQSTTATTAEHTIRQEFDYDHANRLVETRQQVDGQPKLVLAHQEYNELGQIVDKKLHSLDLTSNANKAYLQSVDYRYNIRGWLANINDRNLSNDGSSFNGADPNQDGPNEDPDLFGMELMYNQGQNLVLSPGQYNGNIAEVMWQTRNSATGNKLRGYAYSYDGLNRVTEAAYRTFQRDPIDGQYKWKVFDADYSASNITYDGNGNLRSLDRKGQTSAPNAGTPTWGDIDRLRYYYEGNHLAGADDNAGNAATHDFKDLSGAYTPNSTLNRGEYRYDPQGNLTYDANKSGLQIEYNLLNRPYFLSLNKNGSTCYIFYFYSAAGEKVNKTTYELKSGASYYEVHSTTYAGSFVYEDQILKYTPTPEGRMLYTTAGSPYQWKYEYFLKDHLGNLRFAFRADKDGGTETQRVGMEPANAPTEEKHFKHVAETRLADPDHARTGSYVARLNAHEGRGTGPTITVTVAAGDSIRAEVFGRYDRSRASALALSAAAVSLSPLVTPTPVIPREQNASPATPRRQTPLLGATIALVPALLHLQRAKLPVAYLRYEVFNRDSQLVTTARVPLHRTPNDEWQPLRARFRADSAGYVKVSVENESSSAAYFDDMTVSRTLPSPVQENNYDPFGLNLVGIESSSDYDSQLQYNGKEKQSDFGLNWTDYGARMYDPQLGSWHAVDPLADISRRWSPYTYVYDNPLRFVDPDGMRAWPGLQQSSYESNASDRTNLFDGQDMLNGLFGLKSDGGNNLLKGLKLNTHYIAQGGGGGGGAKLPVVNGLPTVELGTAEVTGHLPQDAPAWAYRFSKTASAGYLEPYRSDGPNPYSPYNPDVVGVEVPFSVSFAGAGLTGKVGLGITNGGGLGYWAIDGGLAMDNLRPSLGVGLNFFMADRMSAAAPSGQFGPFLGDSRYFGLTVPGLSGGYSYSVNADGTPNLSGYQTYSLGTGAGFSASYGQSHAAKIFSFGNPFSNATRGIEPK